jgi:MoxR-like ATPase
MIKVRCIDNSKGYEQRLNIGAEYLVTDWIPNTDVLCTVFNLDKSKHETKKVKASRFELVNNISTPPTKTTMNPLEQSILDVVKEHFDFSLNEGRVKELINNESHSIRQAVLELSNVQSNAIRKDLIQVIADQIRGIKSEQPQIKTIRIETTNKEPAPPVEFDVTTQHHKFPDLLEFLSAGLSVYIYGPTGSGKTQSIFEVAKLLKKTLSPITVSPQTPQSSLLGYMDAHGKYVEGAAYKPYVEGGIFLVNELDNGNAATNTVANQLTDSECFFPCGVRQRHKDFILVATANTLGNGANRQYVGRSPQDKALLNRFVYLNWPWDKQLEVSLATKEWLTYKKDGQATDQQLLSSIKDFWRLRQAIDDLAVDHILSMRNLLQFIRLLAIGTMSTDNIHRATIFRGLDKESGTKIINKAKSITVEDITPVGVSPVKKYKGLISSTEVLDAEEVTTEVECPI